MLIRYDPEADALYVSFRAARPGDAVRTVELDERRRVDYDDRDEPIGLEVLDARDGIHLERVPRADEIREALRAFGELARAA